MQDLFQDENTAREAAPDAMNQSAPLVPVAVPYPVEKAYSYALPDHIHAPPGSYVTVPLGGREVTGVVWDSETDDVPAKKLKSVIAGYDMPLLPNVHRRFIEWVSDYTMAPLGSVLKMTLNTPAALQPPKAVTGYRIAAAALNKTQGLSPKQQAVIDVLDDGIVRRASEVSEKAGVTSGVLKTMVKNNILQTTPIYSTAPCRHPQTDKHSFTLSDAQEEAASHMREAVADNRYETILLDGVTGAGKTETYFEAVAKAIDMDKQVLILLPEIALSNAFLDRFKSRFGCRPALWHSSLTPAQRRNTWRGVAKGETKVVIGARSALFLPYQELGLIIVDEEHDPAYKQEDGVIYHARDMAVVRAHLGKLPIVLVSATPALETIMNTWDGRYTHLTLPDRFSGALLPDIHLIDMRQDRPERHHFISPTLRQALMENLAKHEQSLLFLNRRGYAPLTLCSCCGHRMACPRCTAWLVEHRKTTRLHCHHCGYATKLPQHCPSCEEEDSFTACGPGVERILEEIQEIIPEARVTILSSDTNTTHEELKAKLDDIRNHEYDIIIGTQIIAKGHHFPKLTCVGVVDADLGLQGGDLRAAERTYQLLHQVAGRAGREDLHGHVYLQTWFPANKVMAAVASHDRDTFYEVEAEEREVAWMPPFNRLVGIIVSGKDEKLVQDVAMTLGMSAPQNEKIQTLGPAEAPFYRLRGNYRRRLLVRADKKVNIQKTIDHWLSQHKFPSTIRVYVDIDPQSFF